VNVINNDIIDFFSHIASIGCFSDVDISPVWDDLMTPTEMEKLDASKRMSEINQLGVALAERYFTTEEIRVMGGFEPKIDSNYEDLNVEDVEEYK